MPTSKKQMAARVPAAIEFTHESWGRRIYECSHHQLDFEIAKIFLIATV